VGEEVGIARAEYKGPPELEGIAAEFVLVVAGGVGALAASEIVGSKKVKDIRGFEVGDFVGLAVFVDEEGKVDAGFLLEEARVIGVAKAYGGEGGVFFAEGLLVFAQLRDVLAAEDSAVMAEEDENGGILFPERAEADGFAKGVGERNAGEPLAEGIGHEGND
jgi:hypothetical protein